MILEKEARKNTIRIPELSLEIGSQNHNPQAPDS